MNITPANISSITSARAGGVTGTMSLRPTPDSTLKLMNSSSIQVRAASGDVGAEKLPGYHAWQTENANVHDQASRVNVAPTASSSSRVTRWSPSI